MALEKVGEDADEVARFLSVRGNKDLIFQQLQEVRCVWPGLDEVGALSILLRGRNVEKAEVLGDVYT